MKMMIRQVPIPVAGLALGLTALGNLIQSYSENLRLLCGASAAVLMLLLMARCFFYYEEVRAEFENPVIASVSATVFMTFMQLASYLSPFAAQTAQVIWFAALVGHGMLIVWFTKKFLMPFRIEAIYPTCFVTYVGIVVGAVTSPVFSMQQLGALVFWFGFAAYVAVFGVITYRCLRHPVAESARPLICIYTAPMSLCLTGYLAAVPEKSLTLMILMAVLAQVLYAAVLVCMPGLLKLPFYPSYAAFTFPFVITPFGLMRLIQWMESGGYMVPSFVEGLCILETWVAAGMVLYTLSRYLVFLFGKIGRTNLKLAGGR